MKRYQLIALVSVLVTAMMCSCASAPRSYDDLNEIPGVNNLYIGPGMMAMASGLTNMMGGKAAALTKDLTSARVITVDNAKAVKTVRPFIKKQVKALHCTPIFSTNQGNGEQFSLYATPSHSQEGKYTDVMLISDTSDRMSVMILKGLFSANDLAKVR